MHGWRRKTNAKCVATVLKLFAVSVGVGRSPCDAAGLLDAPFSALLQSFCFFPFGIRKFIGSDFDLLVGTSKSVPGGENRTISGRKHVNPAFFIYLVSRHARQMFYGNLFIELSG